MSIDTLVLDKSGFPITVMNWQDVVTLHCKNRIIVLDEDPEKVLRSPSFEMKMPIVVQLKNDFARRARKEIPFSRRNVIIRDRATCQYCGVLLRTTELTFDHVLPRSRGGKSQWENFVVACIDCNIRKADKTPQEAGMRLLHAPKKPDVRDKRFQFRLDLSYLTPKKRKQFEPWIYWNYPLEA
jgi:5-methylcytosine-specific restriction endonuclease McrA